MYLQRRTKRESNEAINSRISAAMHEYFALSDHDNEESFDNDWLDQIIWKYKYELALK